MQKPAVTPPSATRQAAIDQIVRDAFSPHHCELVNESYMHSVPAGSESHFKLVLVSDLFEGLRPVARHQRVYATLGGMMQQIHALALHTYTLAEWAAQGKAPDSPKCLGGSKHDHP
ncbi:MAG TPA: BolA/IbaG family iron-sulfur metabolism protein [Pseudomonadales bacterium]|nr:BolA/IbaG family iron-sulfur metabolism protein [Pseudomonadales bacterium]